MVDDTRSHPNKTDAHINTQRLWWHAKDLQRFKPNGGPSMRRESGYGLPSLTKKLFAIVIY